MQSNHDVSTLVAYVNAGRFDLKTTDFARSLIASASGPRGLGDSQLKWVGLLIERAELPGSAGASNTQTVRAAPQAESVGDKFERVFELFEVAQSHGVQFPKIRLSTASGQKVVLALNGSGSRTPGQISVTDGGTFGSNRFFGRIGRDGTFTPGRDLVDEVRTFLVGFNAAPAESAGAYGRITGQCCFCKLKLTDAASIAVGYGPTCADNYGLPWGEFRTKTSFNTAATETQVDLFAGLL